MLLRKLYRTMLAYKAQFISMILMTALGTSVFVGFNMEWVSIEENTDAFFEETGYADYRIVSESGFTADEEAKVRALRGVDETARYLSVNADVKDFAGDSLALTVTTNAKVSGFHLVSGEEYDETSADGLWLSEQYAAANDIAVGDSLTLTYRSLELQTTVRGLVKSGEYLVCVRDESQLMPDFATYGFGYVSPVLYEKAVGVAYYPQINVLSELDKKEFIEAVDAALGKTTLILTRDETLAYSSAQGEAEEGKTMGSLLPVIFLLIAVLTMVTTMHRLAIHEKTQIGTLKALGFRDRRILRHYTSYAFMTGLIGSVLGLGLGYGIAWAVMNPNGTMGTYFDMPTWRLRLPWFCTAVLALVVALMTLIGYLSVKQILRGTAAETLLPYVPKKVKPLLVERTRWFHRLSFGTRWNLRDTMRHKSRTAMSLLGVVSCTLILIAVFGMRDTMDAFLDTYYNEAATYASRIYLAEDAAPEARETVAEDYAGDWSASVSVQLEEKAVSLDIYHITHDLIRFPNDGKGYADLNAGGALVCRRLSEEFDLHPGDSFTVSPYGSDETYTLKVAAIVRSMSENIVISEAYAEKLGLPYTMNFVYTTTEKSEIPASGVIRSVQSKQMILDSFDSFVEIMNMMIVVLVLGAMLLCLVVLYNLGVMSYAERYREMATLKVVGFRDRRIGRLLIGQNLWVSVLGILIGLPVGVWLLNVLLHKLASEYELQLSVSPLSFVVTVALTLGVSLLVSLMVARKNKKIDMVEALKGAE